MIIRHTLPYPYAKDDEQRLLHIYLPDNYYAPGNDEHYAVIYMWDGQNLFNDSDATFGKSWGLADYLDNYWKPLIVVGMECAHTSRQRCEEYCPYPVTIGDVGLLTGHAEQTMQWVINDVKPFIDTNFRTWPHREATAVGGSSMGGMMSLYAILKHNGVFSKAAVVSPSVRTAMPHFLNEISHAELLSDTRILLSWGTDEWGSHSWESVMHRNILSLENAIQEQQPLCRTYRLRQEGGQHNEASWQRQLPTIIPFLWEE